MHWTRGNLTLGALMGGGEDDAGQRKPFVDPKDQIGLLESLLAGRAGKEHVAVRAALGSAAWQPCDQPPPVLDRRNTLRSQRAKERAGGAGGRSGRRSGRSTSAGEASLRGERESALLVETDAPPASDRSHLDPLLREDAGLLGEVFFDGHVAALGDP